MLTAELAECWAVGVPSVAASGDAAVPSRPPCLTLGCWYLPQDRADGSDRSQDLHPFGVRMCW